MTDAPASAPTAASVAATLARIKKELPADTEINVDGLIADAFAVGKVEINAVIEAKAPHIAIVGGWITDEGISLADQGLDITASKIEDAVDSFLASPPAPGT